MRTLLQARIRTSAEGVYFPSHGRLTLRYLLRVALLEATWWMLRAAANRASKSSVLPYLNCASRAWERWIERRQSEQTPPRSKREPSHHRLRSRQISRSG